MKLYVTSLSHDLLLRICLRRGWLGSWYQSAVRNKKEIKFMMLMFEAMHSNVSVTI